MLYQNDAGAYMDSADQRWSNLISSKNNKRVDTNMLDMLDPWFYEKIRKQIIVYLEEGQEGILKEKVVNKGRKIT